METMKKETVKWRQMTQNHNNKEKKSITINKLS